MTVPNANHVSASDPSTRLRSARRAPATRAPATVLHDAQPAPAGDFGELSRAVEGAAILRLWRGWRGLTGRERWLALEAWLALPLVAVALRAAGFKQVYRWLGGSSPPAPSPVAQERGVKSAARAANVVDRVARRHPCRPTCLTRSLALWWLLGRRRIVAELRVGVRKEGGSLQAHAWVEVGGHVLGEAGDLGDRFAALERARQ